MTSNLITHVHMMANKSMFLLISNDFIISIRSQTSNSKKNSKSWRTNWLCTSQEHDTLGKIYTDISIYEQMHQTPVVYMRNITNAQNNFRNVVFMENVNITWWKMILNEYSWKYEWRSEILWIHTFFITYCQISDNAEPATYLKNAHLIISV